MALYNKTGSVLWQGSTRLKTKEKDVIAEIEDVYWDKEQQLHAKVTCFVGKNHSITRNSVLTLKRDHKGAYQWQGKVDCHV